MYVIYCFLNKGKVETLLKSIVLKKLRHIVLKLYQKIEKEGKFQVYSMRLALP